MFWSKFSAKSATSTTSSARRHAPKRPSWTSKAPSASWISRLNMEWNCRATPVLKRWRAFSSFNSATFLPRGNRSNMAAASSPSPAWIAIESRKSASNACPQHKAPRIYYRQMTIDERLERLTERHEALTQTVELVGHLQQKNEEALAKNEALMARVIESIDRLARIAQAHEQRISDIEGRQ